MSSSQPEADEPAEGSPRSDSVVATELLPPVERPSAVFILQLFVVPALIVLVIVIVWLSFTWLVRGASARPEDLIQGLQGASPVRWQRASDLAEVLRSNRYPEFKADSGAAAQLAAILSREIDGSDSASGMDESDVMLRYFLCRALGEFHVDDGLPVLLKAATTDRDTREQVVRLGAIEAIAVLLHNLQERESPGELEHPELEPTLIALSRDQKELVRSEAAYALGVLGGAAAISRLKSMIDDIHADTRYNAGLALARHDEVQALPVLAEMLDPAEFSPIAEGDSRQSPAVQRLVIITNALRAVQQLAESSPDADFADVTASLTDLVGTDPADLQRAGIPGSVVDEARRTLRRIQQGD